MISVTQCGNCPVFDPQMNRCKRMDMKMYADEPPCDWATTGFYPEDFIFTEEDTRELRELTEKYDPEYFKERE